MDALTALAGLEGRGTHRLGGNGALQVGVITVEGQVSHQAIAQHGRISQGRANGENGVGRGHTATRVGNHHAVVAGIALLYRGDDERGVGGAHDVVAVELPLIADAFAAAFGDEGRLATCDQAQTHRRGGEDRLGDGVDGVEADVIDAEVPAAGAGLGETEADGGLIVGLGQAEEFHTLGLHRVVVDASLDEGSNVLPLVGGHADEGTIGLADSLTGDRVLIGGGVAVGGNHRRVTIHVASGVLHDVGAVEHVQDRQPGRTLVDGVLHRADAVLVLLVDVVEREVDVGLAGQVDVGREGVLNLAAAAVVGLGVQEFAVDQRLDGLAVDELLGDVQTATHVPLGRFNAGLGNDHPVEVGVAIRVIVVHGAVGAGGIVFEGPTGRDRAFGGGFEGLQPDGGREGDVAGGGGSEGILQLLRRRAIGILEDHRVLGARLQQTRRVVGDRGGPVGLGDGGGHNGAIIGELHRRGRHRTGGSILDYGRDHHARGNTRVANGRSQQ